MELHIDPQSPVPLYHQIAEALRRAIERQELAPGDALEPMRQAAEIWGVNIHTVRHAYAALARDGLIERSRGPRGTRVLAAPRRREVGKLKAFVNRTTKEAAERFGLSAQEFAAAIAPHGNAAKSKRPFVYVVECSDWQCRCHAREIENRFQVDARPWSLDRGEPPDGPIVSTYFHYNDIRKLWPRRLNEVQFVTIYPDPELLDRLAEATHVLVYERDSSTAETVASDLVALLGDRDVVVEPRVLEDPACAQLETEAGPPALFAPRVWAELPPDLQDHPRALEQRYVLDPGEVAEVAKALGWKPRRGVAA